MINFILFGLLSLLLSCGETEQTKKTEIKDTHETSKQKSINLIQKKEVKVEHLTAKTFKEKVFNYETNKEWNFIGDKPCLIDFYASWCGPCKIIAPILEELAVEYEGKINIYKVNTEEQMELSSAFGIRSIPSLLFCPKEGQPQMAAGAMSKQDFKKAIDEILLNKK